LVIFVKKLHVL